MSLATKRGKRSGDLSEVAFERLKQAILSGELSEGARVREARLATEWKVGVTPLREAVRRMAALGYLVLKPNHAPIVRKLTPRDVLQIYQLRELLECFALRENWSQLDKDDFAALRRLVMRVERARTAAMRLKAQLALDARLHDLWSKPRSNPWLAASLEKIQMHRPNLARLLTAHPELADRAFAEHKEILTALEKADVSAALRFLGEHIRKSGRSLVLLLQESYVAP